MATLCGVCGNQTYEGTQDPKTGMWKYRCQYCVDHQNPDGIPCPECGCKSHEDIVGQIAESKVSQQAFVEMNHPLRPEIMMYRCLDCSYEWYNPEYEKFLLGKNVIFMKSNTDPIC